MNIKREARNDALRFARAEMDYGEGAGINRRHLKARLDSKFDDPEYKEAFEAALDKIDYNQIVRDIKVKRKTESFAVNAKKFAKTMAVLTPTACGLYSTYMNNKQAIDSLVFNVKDKLNIKKHMEDKKAREKCIKFVNRPSNVEQELTDEMKATLYLRSKGIRV